MKILKYAFVKLLIPLVLIAVWLLNIRPFTYVISKLNNLLKDPLIISDIPISASSAIDVAILTLIGNVLLDIIEKYIKKPIVISSTIHNGGNNKNLIIIPDSSIGNSDPIHVKIKLNGSISEKFYMTLSKFNSIRIRVLWHSEWLTVAPDFISYAGHLELNEKPGEISFNVFKLFSESDKSDVSFEGRLLIMLNSNFKRTGNISTNIKVEFNNKILNFLFSRIFSYMLIKAEITNCEVVLASKGGY